MFSKKAKTLMAIAGMLVLGGCGNNAFDSIADKNSSAANKEAAQMAIDGGNYQTAVDLLKGACPSNVCSDVKTSQQLAAAYMGQAGLNMLDLAKFADQNKSGTTTSFTTITKSLSYTSGSATAIGSALSVLTNTSQTGLTAAQKNDLNTQIGVTAATSAIIQIGSVTGGFNTTTGLPTTSATIPTATATTVANNLITAANALNQITTTGTNTTAQQIYTLNNNIATGGTTCSGTSTSTTATSAQISAGINGYMTACVK